MDCTSGAEGVDYHSGGCAFLYDVLSGSSIADCCATKCGAYAGSFWYIQTQNVDAFVKGLAAFDCMSAQGALRDAYPRVRVSGCNFTSQDGTWGWDADAAAVYQTSSESSTNASFTLFESCVGGYATVTLINRFYLEYGNAATFVECIFLDSDAAIAHDGATGQDVVGRCFFANTTLKSSVFDGGSVLMRDCLFAGAVPAIPASFTTEGSQQPNTATTIAFDTASLLETCGGPPMPTPGASQEETPKATPSSSQRETPEATSAATPSDSPKSTPPGSWTETPEATQSASPKETGAPTPKETPGSTPAATASVSPRSTPTSKLRETPTASSESASSSGPNSGLSAVAIAGIVSGVLVVIAGAVAVTIFVKVKRVEKLERNYAELDSEVGD
jgi:hypothetical protein